MFKCASDIFSAVTREMCLGYTFSRETHITVTPLTSNTPKIYVSCLLTVAMFHMLNTGLNSANRKKCRCTVSGNTAVMIGMYKLYTISKLV